MVRAQPDPSSAGNSCSNALLVSFCSELWLGDSRTNYSLIVGGHQDLLHCIIIIYELILLQRPVARCLGLITVLYRTALRLRMSDKINPSAFCSQRTR